MDYSLSEQETIARFDRTDAPAMLFTASPYQADKWRKLGYDVKPNGAHGWECTVPKNAVRFRKLVDGALPKRAAPAGFLAARNRKGKGSQE